MSSIPGFRLRHLGAASVLATLLAGCGGDDPAGPNGPSLAGQWQWSVSNAINGSRSCSVTGVTLTISEANGTMTGTSSSTVGNNVTCIVGSQTLTSNFTGNVTLQGVSQQGSSVSFAFPTTRGPWENTGSLTSANAMSGTATIRLAFAGTVVALTGPWTATRVQ